MAELNDLLQVRVGLEMELVTGVEGLELRHQFLQKCLSGRLFVVHVGLRGEDETSGS